VDVRGRRVVAIGLAAGGLYLAGTLSSVLTEHPPPEPKASHTVTEKDGGRTATLIDAWTRPRADAPVAGRAGWRLVAPDQREQMRSGRPSRN